MDNKIFRWYNQNRQKFWITVLTVIAVIVLIHIFNNTASKELEESSNTIEANILYNPSADSSYAIISEKKWNKKALNTIDFFIKCCNEGKIEDAYALLSDDCKEILYPTLESFTNSYYNKIFNTKKLYKAQAIVLNNGWYTFQINFTEDILATGKPSSTSVLDYYTLIKDNRRL